MLEEHYAAYRARFQPIPAKTMISLEAIIGSPTPDADTVILTSELGPEEFIGVSFAVRDANDSYSFFNTRAHADSFAANLLRSTIYTATARPTGASTSHTRVIPKAPDVPRGYVESDSAEAQEALKKHHEFEETQRKKALEAVARLHVDGEDVARKQALFTHQIAFGPSAHHGQGVSGYSAVVSGPVNFHQTHGSSFDQAVASGTTAGDIPIAVLLTESETAMLLELVSDISTRRQAGVDLAKAIIARARDRAHVLGFRIAMGDDAKKDREDRGQQPTLDDPAGKTRYVARYVAPIHRDHSVTDPQPRPPSASQMAAAAAPITVVVPEGVRGKLEAADLDGGVLTIRLSAATVPMRVMAQLIAAAGLEIELIVRRRES